MKNLLLSLFLFVISYADAQQNMAHITLQIHSLKNNDSISLVVRKYGWFNSNPKLQDVVYTSVIRGKSALFQVPTDDVPLRFSIDVVINRLNPSTNRQALVNLGVRDFFLQGGDDVTIVEENGKLSFSGRGFQKYRLIDLLASFEHSYNLPGDEVRYDRIKAYLDERNGIYLKEMKLINSFRKDIDRGVLDLLNAEMIGYYLGRFNGVSSSLFQDKTFRDSISLFREQMSLKIDTALLNKRSNMLYSTIYTDGLYDQYLLDSVILCNHHLDVAKGYQYLKGHFNGNLRERLILGWLYRYKRTKDDLASLCIDALSYMKYPVFRSDISELLKIRQVPNIIYSFNLTDSSGNAVQLSRFKGKIVLVDFWFTYCGACKEMPPAMNYLESRFAGKQVVFLSVNIDRNKKDWLKSTQTGIYTTKGAINLFTGGKAQKHPMATYFNISGAPSLLLFDQEGRFVNIPEPAEVRADGGKELAEIIQQKLN